MDRPLNATSNAAPPASGAGGRDTAQVIGRPPRILLGFLIAGSLLDLAAPAPNLPPGIQYGAGGALIAAGLGLFVWACLTMLRGGTNIPTCQPALRIVTHGPFRLSRNPIYLSMALVFLGAAAMIDSPPMFGLFAVWAVVMEWGVIRPEERYLAARFGEDYLTYRHRVRRWI